MKRFPHLLGLDGLRGLAVLSVLAYHIFARAVPGGFLGVDLFFVLSGFLISSLLIDELRHTNRISLRHFWLRRIRRILPVATVVAFVATALAGLYGGDIGVGITKQFLGSLFFVNNWVQIAEAQSYFHSGSAHILSHYWSLGVEEQFYVVFPLIGFAFLLVKRHKRLNYPFIKWGLGALALIGAIASGIWMALGFNPESDPSRLYFGTDTHAFGLLLGVALACVLSCSNKPFIGVPQVVRDGVAPVAIIATLIGYILCVLLMHWDSAFSFRGGIFLASVLAAIAIGGVALSYQSPKGTLGFLVGNTLLGNSVLRTLGKWSFSIYLWHWPIWVIISRENPNPHIAWRIWGCVLSILIAALSWRFIESPAMRTIGRPWRPINFENPKDQGRLAYRIFAVLLTCLLIVLAIHAVAQSNRPTALEEQLARAKAQVEAQSRSDHPHCNTGVWVLPAITGEDMSAIGDSVMLASVEKLYGQFPGIDIDAAVSRSMPEITDVVADWAHTGRLRPVVVLGVGTNDEVDPWEIDQVMAIVGPDRLVVMTAPYGNRPWIGASITNIFAAAEHYPNLVVADWNGQAIANPQDLAWDGIHPDGDGARLYGFAIAQAMDYFLQNRTHK
ncbi:MAG: acyltransferase family protein [Corynebacterium sp.]|nr:acyltransferase family protein [Corynebacterium sp.]